MFWYSVSVIFNILYFQAFEINAMDDGHHSYLFISLFVLLGIWGFFMVERIIKITVTHQASKVLAKGSDVANGVVEFRVIFIYV